VHSSSQCVAQLHQDGAEHVLAVTRASAATAFAPELVMPRVAFDKFVRVSSDELVSKFAVAELRFENLLHDENPDIRPITDNSDFPTASLGDQRCLRRDDPGAVVRIVSFQRLICVLGCRVRVIADADWVSVEVAEEVRGSTELINQGLLFLS
jgi:hypothetical protein